MICFYFFILVTIKLFKLNPNDVTALNNKGMAYKSIGKYNEALD